MDRVALGVPPAGGAGEELVPGADERAFAVHPEVVGLAPGDQVADRAFPQGFRGRGAQRGPGAPARWQGLVGQHGRRVQQRVAFFAGASDRGGAVQQRDAGGQVVGQFVGAPAGFELGAHGVFPGGPRVGPGVHPERPGAGRVGGDGGGPAVRARVERGQAGVPGHPVGGAAPHDGRARRVVALPPDDGRHRDVLAHDRSGGVASCGDDRRDIFDIDSAGHCCRPFRWDRTKGCRTVGTVFCAARSVRKVRDQRFLSPGARR
nr:hypothetical protein GCM10017745_63540 [Saccharothrix mutabilis subsp. capreolus]